MPIPQQSDSATFFTVKTLLCVCELLQYERNTFEHLVIMHFGARLLDASHGNYFTTIYSACLSAYWSTIGKKIELLHD